MYIRNTRTLLLLALLPTLVLVACDETTSPGIQPEITNAADQFEYQVSDIARYSGTISYVWEISGPTADVNLSTAVDSGDATITIVDSEGVEVFASSLAENGTRQTAAGTAGNWTITVTYTSFSGTVNFRVQKTT